MIPSVFGTSFCSQTRPQRGSIDCRITEISHLEAFADLVPSIQNSFVANFESSAKREIASVFFRGTPPAFSRNTPLTFSRDAPSAFSLPCFFSIPRLYSLQSSHFPVIVPLHNAVSHWHTFVEFILEDAFPHWSAQTKIFGSLEKEIVVISRFSTKHRLALICFYQKCQVPKNTYCDVRILPNSLPNEENDKGHAAVGRLLFEMPDTRSSHELMLSL